MGGPAARLQLLRAARAGEHGRPRLVPAGLGRDEPALAAGVQPLGRQTLHRQRQRVGSGAVRTEAETGFLIFPRVSFTLYSSFTLFRCSSCNWPNFLYRFSFDFDVSEGGVFSITYYLCKTSDLINNGKASNVFL